MKTIKLLFFSLLIGNSLSAQKFSVGLSGGYGIPVFKEKLYDVDAAYNGSIKPWKGSFGQGSKFFVDLEYSIAKHVCLNFSGGYHLGYSFSVHNELYPNYQSIQVADTTSWNKISQYQLIPGLKITTSGKLKLYLKCGFVLGLGGKMTESFDSRSYEVEWVGAWHMYIYHPIYTHTDVKYTNGLTYGLASGLGIEVPLYKNLGLICETILVKMNWSHGKIEKNETIVRDSFYPNYYTGSTTSSVSNNEFKEAKPYSSINVLLGLKWTFGKKVENPTVPVN